MTAREERIVAVVVSYQRRELLRRCLDAIEAQTRPPDLVIVVDNGSTDGSRDDVRARRGAVTLIATARNGGGAGGFARGLAWALETGATRVWLMDDDAIPDARALEHLARALEADESAPFASPVVDDASGRLDPHVVIDTSFARARRAAERGAVSVIASSFVGPLVRAASARETVLPYADFFIWHDDTEYTARLATRAPGIAVPAARITHLAASRGTRTFAPDRAVANVRNLVWCVRLSRSSAIATRQWLEYLRVAIVSQTKDAGIRHAPAAARALAVGLWLGVTRRPSVDVAADLVSRSAREDDVDARLLTLRSVE